MGTGKIGKTALATWKLEGEVAPKTLSGLTELVTPVSKRKEKDLPDTVVIPGLPSWR